MPAERRESIFTTTNTLPVCANGPYITLSATRDGIHTVDVGTNKPIFDIFENKPLGKGPILKFDMKSGDVKLLKIQE